MSAQSPGIGTADVHDVVGRWWFNYDEGNFDVLTELLTDDVHFSCRTDTGATDFEDFVHADVRGREAVMAWQTGHRVNSPYPLRHNGTNIHIVAQHDNEARFASNIFVTHITEVGVTNLSTALVYGTVRRVGDELLFADLEVVLDTRTSVRFGDAVTAVPLTDKAQATRAALVRSAGKLFEASGYGAVSVRDLARKNELTSGAIYGHFRNKADLLAAAIADRIETDLEGPRFGTGGLTDYLARQWRAYRSRRGLRALLIEGAHASHVDDEARVKIGALYEAKLDEWRTIYRSLQDQEGVFAAIDMDTLVTMLFATELGLGVLEAADVELPKPSAWSATLRQLLKGVDQ